MSTLQHNLNRLHGTAPDLVVALKAAAPGALTIQPAKNGMPTATRKDRALHSAYDPWREAQAWAESRLGERQDHETVVIAGVGLLYHVRAVCAQLPPDVDLCVLVPELGELHDVLSVIDASEWMGRVQWLWGEPEDVGGALAKRFRQIRMLTHAPTAAAHDGYLTRVQQALREGIVSQRGGQLHVSVIGPLYGGSLPVARHVVQALEQLGHRVSWIDHSMYYEGYRRLDGIRDAHLRNTIQNRLCETLGVVSLAHIADDPPDVALAMAQAPLSMPVLQQLRRKNVLTAMWFVENFRHLTYWQQVAEGYDFWFVMQRQACIDALKRAGAPHVAYLPLAANTSIHRPVTLSPQEAEEFVADVSFLGAGYRNRRVLLPMLLDQPWTFKLWGNEWENAGPLASALQRGGARIDTDTSVNIFNATRVNLNLHSYTGEGFDPEGDCVNPRTFELAACGAFQIVDRRTLLAELFDDSMMSIIDRPDELVPAVRRSVNDSAECAAMADASRQHVLAHHTYVHRMQTLLAEIGMQCPDRVGDVLRGDRNAAALREQCGEDAGLRALLQPFGAEERVELKDVASTIRAKGPMAVLNRDELLVLMIDEYRKETRDFL